MLNWRLKEGYYPIPLWLHRDQIEKMGYDASQLTDGDMEYLAKRIADDFLSQYYSEALRRTFDYYIRCGRISESNNCTNEPESEFQ